MLYKSIEQLAPENLILANYNSSYTAGDIKSFRFRYYQKLLELNGKAIAIKFKDSIEVAKWLILLDGIAKSILILPHDIDTKTESFYLTTSKSDLLENITCSNMKKKHSIRSYETEWIICTSGTTNTPKLVTHTLSSLSNTVRKGNKGFIWGLIYGIHRFAGLQVFLQSIQSGNKLFIKESTQSLTETISFFLDNNVSCLSATPTLYRKLLMTEDFSKLQLKIITLGGEIANQNIINALKSTFQTSNVRHIYASTEAGVGFSIKDGKEGFPKEFLSLKSKGFELKLSSENTLMIKSPSNAIKYINSTDLKNNKGFIDTGDLIKVVGNRCLFVGRLSGIINVGGNKVVPEFVESILTSFEEISEARVYGKENSIMGNLVCADLILKKDQLISKKEILLRCKDKLHSYQIPAFLFFKNNLNITNTGKIKR